MLYSVRDLGVLGPDLTYVVGTSINNMGEVTGYAAIPEPNGSGGSPAHAFLYSNGQIMDLGTFGGQETFGYSVNNAAQITGSIQYTGFSRAFLYGSGQVTDLRTLGGQSSIGYGINDQGDVTGYSFTTTGNFHAFLYSNGYMMDLGTLGGPSVGRAINNAGQVTGSTGAADSPPYTHAFLYTNGQMINLGTLGGLQSMGAGINSSGQVVGSSATAAGPGHAFLYSNRTMIDLGTLGGGGSFGDSINDHGQVTGGAETSAGPAHAFLYSNGQMVDLNTLIDPALGLTLYEATHINNDGQIVANGQVLPSRAHHAYLLTPVPEPSTVALFGIALVGLAASVHAVKSRIKCDCARHIICDCPQMKLEPQ